MNPTFKKVYDLADRVMGWYGFSQESDYRMLELAIPVAVELLTQGFTADENAPTPKQVEQADVLTGRKMGRMFESAHPARGSVGVQIGNGNTQTNVF